MYFALFHIRKSFSLQAEGRIYAVGFKDVILKVVHLVQGDISVFFVCLPYYLRASGNYFPT